MMVGGCVCADFVVAGSWLPRGNSFRAVCERQAQLELTTAKVNTGTIQIQVHE